MNITTDKKCPICNIKYKVIEWSPIGYDLICPKCTKIEKRGFNNKKDKMNENRQNRTTR